MRGIPDDFPAKGYKYAPLVATSINNTNEGDYYDGELDSQADLFTFSFNGRTGKFLIAKNGKVIIIPQSRLRVEPEFEPGLNAVYTLAGFTVTDEDGVRYEFKEIETTNISYQGGTAVFINKDFPIAWHLTRIVAPFNTDTILFQYRTVSHSVRQHPSQSVSISPTNVVEYLPIPDISYITNKAKKVYQIVLPANQKVTFEYMDRYDNINGDSLLKAIKFFNNDVFKSGYRLDYYYQNGSQYIANPEFQLVGTSLVHNAQRNRAFLRRIMKETSWGFFPSYEFSYNNQYFLPPKFKDDASGLSAASRDHWVFFNGKINSTSIPSATGFTGANREPSSTHVLAGSLSKIIFPNGAVREYQFESNDRLQVNSEYKNISFWSSAPGSNAISLSQYYSNKHKLLFVLDKSNLGNTNPFSGTCVYTFNIKNTGGQTVASLPINLNGLFNAGSITWELALPNGTYYLESTKPGTCNLSTDCKIDVTWTNGILSNSKVLGGGLRIKKVLTYPGNNTASPETTEYRYTTADGTASSGYMAQIPKYDYTFKKYNGGTYDNYRVITSDPLNSLGYASGNPIGYSRVEVLEGQSGANIGRTVYEFTDFRDIQINNNVSEFPFAPFEKADWGLGLPKTISVYDNNGRLKKKTINTYNIIQEKIVNDSIASVQLGVNGLSSMGSLFAYQWYYPVTGRSELIKTEDSTFYDDGSKLNEVTQFSYNADHYNLKAIVKDLDQQSGLKIEKRLYYSSDYTISSGPIKALKDKGIIKLISTEEWIIGDATPRITGGQITDFQIVNGSVVRPYKNFSFNSTTPVAATTMGNFNPAVLNRKPDLFTLGKTFAQYDNKGFLVQTIGEGGQTSLALFSPDKQSAIAKVINADISEIAYTSFETTEKGYWSYTGVPLLNNTAVTGNYVYDLSRGTITRSSLSTNTSFNVTFWAKNGTPTITGAALIKSEINTRTGWTYYEYKVTNQSTVIVGGSGLLDELRLYPVGSQMTTSSYEPFIGITSECDVNNRTSYYIYDNLNRLALVKDQNKQIVRKMEYATNSVLHAYAIWDYTGQKRCQQDQYGNTGKLEAEQVDINMNSSGFGSKQWVIVGNSTICYPVEVWQNTGNKRCKQLNDGNNTGEVEVEQKNVNPNTNSYGALRWVSGGIDRQFCPDLCIGEGKRIVNGICEYGVKEYTFSEEISPGLWECWFRYTFSDGTATADTYRETSTTSCTGF